MPGTSKTGRRNEPANDPSRRRARLADATLQAYRSRLNAKLDALLFTSYRTHAAGGEKLKAAIEACRHSLFVFLANLAVPPTNNGSEQALLVFRKVTNCFRSEWAAHLYADIRSVIETARRRAIGVLDAIRATLNGSPLDAAASLLTATKKG